MKDMGFPFMTGARDDRNTEQGAGHLLAWIPVTVGLVTAIVGVMEYRGAQQWKRAEFLAAQVKEFESRPGVIVSMLMLDWNERRIELFPGRVGSADVVVNDSLLAGALIPHTEKPNGDFSEVETRIRDSFDQFFDGLERFDHFIQAGLVSDRDVTPYLGYWLEIIGSPESERKPPELIRGIWRYLGCYRYEGVVSLLRRQGYMVTPGPACR